MSAIPDQRTFEAAGAVLTVDLAALRGNYAHLAARAWPAHCAGVVKADAYGLGCRPVARALHGAGCRDFFVAHLSEGLDLRRTLREDEEIYVLNGLQPGGESACADAGLIPVLNGLDQVEAWARTAGSRGRRLRAALQVDTGMSRLGLSPDEVDALSGPRRGALDAIDVALVMSHLACADDPNHPANADQLSALRRVLGRFPGARVSLANSGGVYLDPAYRFDLVRPGIALYGASPVPGVHAGLSPVVRLDARVIQVRTIPAGTTIGYGASFVADRTMRVATVALGYADGWPRVLGGRGGAYYRGIRLPVVGRVSMDSLTLDVGVLPDGVLSLGSLVEMIGPNQTLDDVASQCGTITYEILTGLGRRFERRYVSDAAAAAGND